MKRLALIILLYSGILLGRPARADHVILRDGTVQEGVIVSKEANEIRLLPDNDKTRRVIIIPRSKIAEIKEMIGPEPASNSAGKNAATAPNAPAHPHDTDGFFSSIAKLALGVTPDLGDPNTMSPAGRILWQKVLVAEAQNSKPDLIAALTGLANACNQDAPRLDALARRHVNVPYGQWLAPLRWNTIKNNYHTGRLDLNDVTEIERTALIGILRQETEPAVLPLRPYFPKPHDPGAHPTPGQAPIDPLAGISIGNALEVKNQALYASAVLLAQLRLEPDMPFVDRAFLSKQLVDVRAALAKTLTLEPLARRAAQSPEAMAKIMEEMSRREAAKQAAREAMNPLPPQQ